MRRIKSGESSIVRGMPVALGLILATRLRVWLAFIFSAWAAGAFERANGDEHVAAAVIGRDEAIAAIGAEKFDDSRSGRCGHLIMRQRCRRFR